MSIKIPFPDEKYISFEQWYREILLRYRKNKLPVPMPAEPWYDTANRMLATGFLKHKNLVSIDINATDEVSWTDWARTVYLLLYKK